MHRPHRARHIRYVSLRVELAPSFRTFGRGVLADRRSRAMKTCPCNHSVHEHVGVLFNGPPGSAGLPLNQSSNNFDSTQTGIFSFAAREDSVDHRNHRTVRKKSKENCNLRYNVAVPAVARRLPRFAAHR